MKNEKCRTNTRNSAIANRLRVSSARNVTAANFKEEFLTVEVAYMGFRWWRHLPKA